jgi:hypothetical protein
VGSGIATTNGTQTMTTIKLFGGDFGTEEMMIRCNLSEASAPVEVDYRTEIQDVWLPTQYQSADVRHRTRGLIAIGKQLAAEAFGIPEDEFTCEAIEV